MATSDTGDHLAEPEAAASTPLIELVRDSKRFSGVLRAATEAKAGREALRVWLCACASGLEAEAVCAALAARGAPFSLFVTGRDGAALGSADRLQAAGGRIAVAAHDLLADEPLSGAHLVLCGADLSRLAPADQRRSLDRIVSALAPGGLLALVEPGPDLDAEREQAFGCTLVRPDDPRRLRRRLEQLERENQRKEDFVAVLGHELRNPLAAISTAAQMQGLLGATDPRMQRTREVIERQTRHMKKLIDDLLDVSRIARGKIQLERSVLDLRPLLRAVAEDHKSTAEPKGVSLSVELPGEPLWANVDPTRIVQVVANLIQNALKFSDPGATVAIIAKAEPGRVLVRVQDSGIGIEASELDTLFTPAGPRRGGGLGIGLSLVKGLAELHGGAVCIHSDGKGKGTEVTVTLPAAAAAEVSRATASARPRILVVDDNRDSADMLRDALDLAGYQVDVAYSGEEAIDLARKHRHPVVLCDIGLPTGMDGYEVARAFKADRALGSPYLVAITGYGRKEDQENARAAGFDDHLTKPVDLARIERLLAERPQRKEAGVAAPA